MKRRRFTEKEAERLERLRIARMREEYRSSTPGERIERAIELSEQVNEFRATLKIVQ